MWGLRDLIAVATWPDDTPARREARGILYIIAALWVALLATPFALAWVFGGF